MNDAKSYVKTQRAKEFISSEQGLWAYEELLKMVEDEGYNTVSTYSPASEDGVLLFVDKHMGYLCSHLGVKPLQYISNLQLVTKRKV